MATNGNTYNNSNNQQQQQQQQKPASSTTSSTSNLQHQTNHQSITPTSAIATLNGAHQKTATHNTNNVRMATNGNTYNNSNNQQQQQQQQKPASSTTSSASNLQHQTNHESAIPTSAIATFDSSSSSTLGKPSWQPYQNQRKAAPSTVSQQGCQSGGKENMGLARFSAVRRGDSESTSQDLTSRPRSSRGRDPATTATNLPTFDPVVALVKQEHQQLKPQQQDLDLPLQNISNSMQRGGAHQYQQQQLKRPNAATGPSNLEYQQVGKKMLPRSTLNPYNTNGLI